MKYYDQHVHSYYSFDSEQKIEEYLSLAVKMGIAHFVLTDHLDLNYLDSGKDLSFDIQKQHEELMLLQKQYPNIQMLKGIEIGYKPNELNHIRDIIKNNRFDVINFSLHESDGIDFYYKEPFIERGPEKTIKLYFQRLLEMVNDFDDYDVLCHLDFGFKTFYLIDSKASINEYQDIIKEILKVIIKKDKTLEINTKVQEMLPLEHTISLLRMYKDLGGKNLTLSSDAHKANRYCSSFEKYLELIKNEGFDHLCYFIGRERYEIKI